MLEQILGEPAESRGAARTQRSVQRDFAVTPPEPSLTGTASVCTCSADSPRGKRWAVQKRSA